MLKAIASSCSVFLILSAILLSPVSWSEEHSGSNKPEYSDLSAVNALIAQLGKIQSISGSFVQIAVDQRGVTIQETKGQFKAKRPGFFYWRTSEPLEQEIYSDGERVVVFDPDLEQATIQSAGKDVENTPAVLFSGDPSKVSAIYEVERLSLEGQGVQYLLRPKSTESVFDRLRLRFDGLQLSEMRLRDSLGQESSISFIQTEINPSLTAADFEPDLPEGTDIIEDLPLKPTMNPNKDG